LDEVKYGRWTRLVVGIGLYRLKPDIFNYKPVRVPKRYVEIKPLSPSGIVAGGLQMYARSLQFGPLGFNPDAMWRPSTNVGTTISGTKIVFFNDGGLIFYFDITADIEDLLIVAAGRP